MLFSAGICCASQLLLNEMPFYNNSRMKKVLHFQGKFLSSGMEPAMDFNEVASVYMSIDLRR